jgi:hypothetical protein
MKQISEMNFAEVSDFVETYVTNSRTRELANRLRELYERHRWIPVEERLPTKEEIPDNASFWVYIHGIVTEACFEGGKILVWDEEEFNSGWSEYKKDDYRTAFTHWRRIDAP